MNIKWQEESRLNASVLTLRVKLKSQKLARNTCIGALDSVHSKFRNELSFSLRFRRQQFWIMRSVFFFERQCKDHVTCQTQITAIVKNIELQNFSSAQEFSLKVENSTSPRFNLGQDIRFLYLFETFRNPSRLRLSIVPFWGNKEFSWEVENSWSCLHCF